LCHLGSLFSSISLNMEGIHFCKENSRDLKILS
jgi:hypothetical protein